ncbi:hypothetical protein BDR26DRAFT_853843 [Obelidium mucronatum]|nr:hypothetical protein BDR26DRAFT_853843 [Obelidium mucronatum]
MVFVFRMWSSLKQTSFHWRNKIMNQSQDWHLVERRRRVQAKQPNKTDAPCTEDNLGVSIHTAEEASKQALWASWSKLGWIKPGISPQINYSDLDVLPVLQELLPKSLPFDVLHEISQFFSSKFCPACKILHEKNELLLQSGRTLSVSLTMTKWHVCPVKIVCGVAIVGVQPVLDILSMNSSRCM